MRWIASVILGDKAAQRSDLSNETSTSLELPPECTCVVGPIVRDDRGDERVRVDFGGRLSGTFDVTSDAPRIFQFPPDEACGLWITILVGCLDDPDGGSRAGVELAA